MSYYEIYRKRLNRYGSDFQSRIQNQRERDFENYLLKSVYRIDFEFEDKTRPGTLEPYKQDSSQTLGYLLTQRAVEIPAGTELDIISQDGQKQKWLVWWLEHVEASGYNRYVALKIDYSLIFNENEEKILFGYFKGPGASAISDTIKSASGEAVYKQNDTLCMFICSAAPDVKNGDCFEIEQSGKRYSYIVAEVDNVSTPGISYISFDPSYVRESTKQQETEASHFWLNGGKE